MKHLLIVLLIVGLTGCRTVRNVTQSDKKQVKTEQVDTITKETTNKLTEVKIPVELFKRLMVYKEDSSGNNSDLQISKDTARANQQTVTITTKENTVTETKQDKQVKTTTEEETKTETTKEPVFQWNYIWILVGLIAIPVVVRVVYVMWFK